MSKKTYEQMIEFQNIGLIRITAEKKSKKQTKAGAALLKLIGDPQAQIKGSLSPHAEEYEEQNTDLGIDHCSTDPKDDTILKDQHNQLKFTKENQKKYNKERKKLLKKEVVIKPSYCSEVPADITDAEKKAYIGFIFDPANKEVMDKLQADSELEEKTEETKTETPAEA